MNLLILESLGELWPKCVARVKGPKGGGVAALPLTRIATPKAPLLPLLSFGYLEKKGEKSEVGLFILII